MRPASPCEYPTRSIIGPPVFPCTCEEITFGQFRLDMANECLWQGTRAISLRPKAFAVLRLLLEHPGELVNKQQVLDAVWPGDFRR